MCWHFRPLKTVCLSLQSLRSQPYDTWVIWHLCHYVFKLSFVFSVPCSNKRKKGRKERTVNRDGRGGKKTEKSLIKRWSKRKKKKHKSSHFLRPWFWICISITRVYRACQRLNSDYKHMISGRKKQKRYLRRLTWLSRYSNKFRNVEKTETCQVYKKMAGISRSIIRKRSHNKMRFVRTKVPFSYPTLLTIIENIHHSSNTFLVKENNLQNTYRKLNLEKGKLKSKARWR